MLYILSAMLVVGALTTYLGFLIGYYEGKEERRANKSKKRNTIS
jgi:phage-related minor tail protein